MGGSRRKRGSCERKSSAGQVRGPKGHPIRNGCWKGAKTFTSCWSCLHQGLAKELLQTKEGIKKKKKSLQSSSLQGLLTLCFNKEKTLSELFLDGSGPDTTTLRCNYKIAFGTRMTANPFLDPWSDTE